MGTVKWFFYSIRIFDNKNTEAITIYLVIFICLNEKYRNTIAEKITATIDMLECILKSIITGRTMANMLIPLSFMAKYSKNGKHIAM